MRSHSDRRASVQPGDRRGQARPMRHRLAVSITGAMIREKEDES